MKLINTLAFWGTGIALAGTLWTIRGAEMAWNKLTSED